MRCIHTIANRPWKDHVVPPTYTPGSSPPSTHFYTDRSIGTFAIIVVPTRELDFRRFRGAIDTQATPGRQIGECRGFHPLYPLVSVRLVKWRRVYGKVFPFLFRPQVFEVGGWDWDRQRRTVLFQILSAKLCRNWQVSL